MVTDESARQAAREILARDVYTRWYDQTDAWLRALERLLERIPDWLIEVAVWLQEGVIAVLEWLGWFLGFFGLFGEASTAVGWVAIVLFGALALFGASRWRARRDALVGHREQVRTPGQLHATALREARALAERGHSLEAAHRVQLATIALLVEFEWLELARSDPNRTLRARVAASRLPAREQGELVRLVDRIESIWFNEHRDDRALFDDWISLDERIVSIASLGRGGFA